jgi:predicted amidohydrolase
MKSFPHLAAAVGLALLALAAAISVPVAGRAQGAGPSEPSGAAPSASVPAPPAVVPGTVRIAGIVLKWIRGDKEANFRRLEPLLRQAAAGGARIVCTTECFLDGYAIADKTIPLETYRALGERIPDGPYSRRLAALTRELRIHLVAGLHEADGDNRYNTAVLFGPDGELLGKYRKQMLEHESVRNTPGDSTPVFSTPFGRVGLIICADRKNADIVRRIREAGADFFLCPSGGMFGPKSNDPILQARSRENKVHIVFVHPAEFLVTGPDGSILLQSVLGDRLLVRADEAGSPADRNQVYYYDMPLK